MIAGDQAYPQGYEPLARSGLRLLHALSRIRLPQPWGAWFAIRSFTMAYAGSPPARRPVRARYQDRNRDRRRPENRISEAVA
jgi:hypothetical protein